MNEEFCMAPQPSMRERFWRAFGFRYNLVELPPEADTMPGWAITTARLKFSFRDRVRLLMSGGLRLDIRHGMDAPVSEMISATSFEIEAPFSEATRHD